MSDYASTPFVEPLAVPGWLSFRDRAAGSSGPGTRGPAAWRRLLRLRPTRAPRGSDPAHLPSSGPSFSPSQHRGHQMLLLDDRTVIGNPGRRACAGARSV